MWGCIDTTNPYLNLENKFEDLTVNQAQAQFESQQFQQSQANILDSLKGAAGGGGVAALAQSLAQQGQLAAQKSAVSIGQQEQANQMKERTEASRLDTLERQGVEKSRTMERDKYATLLGMSQQETAGYRDERLAWQQQQQSATANLFSSVTDLGTGLLNTMTG